MEGLTQEQTIENLNAQVASLDAMNMERLKELHQVRTTLIVKDNHINKLIKQIQDLQKEKSDLQTNLDEVKNTLSCVASDAQN